MKSFLRPPFVWYGGKGNLVRWLLERLPAHEQYIEPFFGAGALFFAKKPAGVETINDINSDVIGFFRVLRERLDEFIKLAAFTPYSREVYDECQAGWDEEEDPLRRAWMWWVVARMSFSGKFHKEHKGHWAYSVASKSRGMAEATSNYLSAVDSLDLVAQRLLRTQIENRDGVLVMEKFCTPDSLCYCDPPYIHATRTSDDDYANEMTDDDHRRLVEALLSLPGRFMVSGYHHPIYDSLEEAGWTRLDKNVATVVDVKRDGKVRPRRTESLWLDSVSAREKAPEQSLPFDWSGDDAD